jgi:hypothetical protein
MLRHDGWYVMAGWKGSNCCQRKGFQAGRREVVEVDKAGSEIVLWAFSLALSRI